MVIIKNYKVKKIFNKFPQISGKIGINFRKFSGEIAVYGFLHKVTVPVCVV